MKPGGGSPAGFERSFGLFGVFAYHGEAWSRRGSEAFGTSKRFSTRLAPTSRCAKLQQNAGHHATDLLWSDRTRFGLPGPMQCLSQLTCQIQLIQHESHHPTPALKLLGRAHMHAGP